MKSDHSEEVVLGPMCPQGIPGMATCGQSTQRQRSKWLPKNKLCGRGPSQVSWVLRNDPTSLHSSPLQGGGSFFLFQAPSSKSAPQKGLLHQFFGCKHEWEPFPGPVEENQAQHPEQAFWSPGNLLTLDKRGLVSPRVYDNMAT